MVGSLLRDHISFLRKNSLRVVRTTKMKLLRSKKKRAQRESLLPRSNMQKIEKYSLSVGLCYKEDSDAFLEDQRLKFEELKADLYSLNKESVDMLEGSVGEESYEEENDEQFGAELDAPYKESVEDAEELYTVLERSVGDESNEEDENDEQIWADLDAQCNKESAEEDAEKLGTVLETSVGARSNDEENDPLLDGAEGAAKRFRWGLVKYFGYEEKNATLLLDRNEPENGTADHILCTLDGMLNKAVARDKVLFFYCGHGGCEDPHSDLIKDYYMSCARNTYIDGERLKSVMHNASLRSIDLTIVLDCCSSAGLFQGLADEQIRPKTVGYKLSSDTSSAIMIGSCRKDQDNVTAGFDRRFIPCYVPVFPKFYGRDRTAKKLKCVKTMVFKQKRVVKKVCVYSSDFVEYFLKATNKVVKKANGVIPPNFDLVNRTARRMKKACKTTKELNGIEKKNLQVPQLFCSSDQANSKFS